MNSGSGKIMKAGEVSLYSMPQLSDDRTFANEMDSQLSAEVQRAAYEKGFSSGEKAGLDAAEERASIVATQIQQMLNELAETKEKLVDNLEDQVIDLAVAIAGKIVDQEIKEKPEHMVTIVKKALKKLQRSGTVTIKINPVLLDTFRKSKAELGEIHEDIRIETVDHLPVADPIVTSETEEVMADLDSLLHNISEEIKNGRNEND